MGAGRFLGQGQSAGGEGEGHPQTPGPLEHGDEETVSQMGGGDGRSVRWGTPRGLLNLKGGGPPSAPWAEAPQAPSCPGGSPPVPLPAVRNRVQVSGQGPGADSAAPASRAQSSRCLWGISSCFCRRGHPQPPLALWVCPTPLWEARARPSSPLATGLIWLLL